MHHVRLLRAWLPALLAALLWLLSAGLEWLSHGTTNRVLQVLDLLAPETVPLDHLSAPAPWGLVVGASWALAVLGAYAALLAVVRTRRREAPPATTFAAYWMCAVVAAAGVAAVPVVDVVVRALAAGDAPSGLGGLYLVTAAHWGLVWGWAPALLALLLDGAGATSRWHAAAVGVLVFVTGAVGVVLASAEADGAGSADPAGAAADHRVDPARVRIAETT